MKKSLLPVILVCLSLYSFAQTGNIKLPSFAFHVFATDFKTAADIRNNTLASVISDKQYFKLNRMAPGLAFSYLKGISKHIDFSATLSASFVNYPVPGKTSDGTNALFDATATGNFKLLSDKYYVNPFFTIGAGAAKYRNYYSAFIPAGIGVQVKIVNDIFLLLNSQYRIPVTEFAAYHFYHSGGIAAPINTRKEVITPVEVVPPVISDRDNDGVADTEDKCPDIAGIALLQGCPDRDADGIADGDDQCPDRAGLAKYKGCPVPDTDGDGINDEEDKCPGEKGFARYQGCPVPDTDGDGVNDEEDKCPNRQGPATNMGCPEIEKAVIEKFEYAARNVFFATGSYKLLPKSFKSLDEVAALMIKDELLLVDIDGHTDSQGSDEANQALSQNRAGAVLQYLAGKGVSETRMKATGYGETKPITDNKTAAGRAKNRRVEMTVRNY